MKATRGHRSRARSSVFVVLVAVLAVVLAACGGSSKSSSGSSSPSGSASLTPKTGGTLTFDAFAEIKSWKVTDLADQNGGEDRGNFVYDTLVIDTPTGGWSPNIATAFTTTDNKTWTMKLHPNVKFSDGTPLDAAAVVWNINNLLDPKNAFGDLGEITQIAKVTAVDAQTVQFDLNFASGSLPLVFGSLPGMMMSPTAYQKDPNGFANNPVGAGPFLVKSFVRDSTTTLVRNPTYWDAPKPYLDGVNIKIVTDGTVRAQDLQSGQVDLVANQAQVQAVAIKDSRFKVFTSVLTGAIAFVPNQDKAPFNDPTIRQAMALGWDYGVVNASIEQGAWPDMTLDCPPSPRARPNAMKALGQNPISRRRRPW